MTKNTWTVGEIASHYGVTVRTLHHYDAIGLLQPTSRSPAGYRLYTPDDIERLARIIRLRRMGLATGDIASIIDGEPHDALVILNAHKDHLVEQQKQTEQHLTDITQFTQEITMNNKVTPDDMRRIFGTGFDDAYAQEAEEKWGNTSKWAESQARTAHFTTADWQRVKDDSDALKKRFASAMEAGHAIGSPHVGELVDEHLRQLNVFYDASPAFAAELAPMYVTDERFAASYNDVADGLAQYVHDAIIAHS